MQENIFMDKALKKAKTALKRGEIPVCALIVDNEQNIISYATNKGSSHLSMSSHAEIRAIQKALTRSDIHDLSNCTIYVTLEPCIMCYGAILNARIKKLVIGAESNKGFSNYISNFENIEIIEGIKREECKTILQSFFILMRHKNKSNN